MHASHDSHALVFCVKPWVTQEPPDKFGRFGWFYVEPHQAVTSMTQGAFEEVLIAGEQSRLFEVVKKRDDVVVPDAQIGEVNANDAAPNAPSCQNVPLVGRAFSSRRFTPRGSDARLHPARHFGSGATLRR
jgi:hypothetical protein